MKRAEDFREAFGPVDSGFNMVVDKTIEELKTKEQKKRPLAAIYPIRFRVAALAAAVVVLLGAGIWGITGRNGGPDLTDENRDINQYTPQTIEMALTQGSGQDAGSDGTGEEAPRTRTDEFDPEKDVIQLPGITMSYACTLQDGRLLMTGTEMEEGPNVEYYIWKARLLCLNPDGTVSWEYTGPEEKFDGQLWFDNAATLTDGTIAVVHSEFLRCEPDDIVTVQFFTPDGKRIDKGTETFKFTGNIAGCMPQPSFLMVERRDSEGKSTGTEVMDWDGNLITRYMEDQFFNEDPNGWMPGDELVIYGHPRTDETRAKIVKMDGLTDKVLWEKTLDYQWPDTDGGAGLSDVVKTGDNGYAALLREHKYGATEDDDITRYAVVKFDASGNIQWIRKADFQNNGIIECNLYMHDGKIVLLCDTMGEVDSPCTARWFDEEGNSLGTTELEIKPEYFAVLSRMTEPKNKETPRLLSIAQFDLISRPDGLWALVRGCLNDYYRSENELGPVDGSDDTIMIRIPEPAAESASAESGQNTEKDSPLARDEEICRAREAIAGAYPDLDLLNTAEYGFEGNVQEWGTEVHFKTHNINHGDVQAAILTNGTIEMYSADREKAEDVNTLFRRYQSAYGRISRWNQETWVQLAKDIEPLKLNGEDPDLLEGKLLKTARFPEENTVSISRDEACGRMWETAHGEDDFCVLIDSDPHPVWKFLSNTWPVKRLLEIDAETGEVVADELCDTGRTPAYALYSTEKNRRALELKELGTKEIARREVRYAFAEMNEELEEPLPMPDFDNPEEYTIQVNGRTARFTGRRSDLKTIEVELDENGYVARYDITDTISGQDRTKTPDEGSQAAKKEAVLLGNNEFTEERVAAMKEFMVPLNLSCEDRGIRIELLSGLAKGNEAWFLYTMQAIEEDRTWNMGNPFFDCDFGSEKQQDSLLLDHDEAKKTFTYCVAIQFINPIDFSERTATVSLYQLSDDTVSKKVGNWEYQFLLSRIAAEDSNK